jgi:hypothetical protein
MKKQILLLMFCASISILTAFGFYCVSSIACENLQAKNKKCADTVALFCPAGVSESVCTSKFDATLANFLPLDYEEAVGEKLVDVTVTNPTDGLLCYTYAQCKYYPNDSCLPNPIRTPVYVDSWWETTPCP